MAHEVADIADFNRRTALAHKDGIQRPDQIGCAIDKRAVEVENECRRGHEGVAGQRKFARGNIRSQIVILPRFAGRLSEAVRSRQSMAGRAGIILAAGQGTRMKSAKPKVMHAVAGRPILGHVIAALKGAGVSRIVVVTAPDAEEVRAYRGARRRGKRHPDRTVGHGTRGGVRGVGARDFRRRRSSSAMATSAVYAGDVRCVVQGAREGRAWRLSRSVRKASAYGRVIVGSDGMLDRIVEYKDAKRRRARRRSLQCRHDGGGRETVLRLGGKARETTTRRRNTTSPTFRPSQKQTASLARWSKPTTIGCRMGVNSRAELAAAEAEMQKRLRAAAMANGVGMIAPETVYPQLRHGAGSRCAARAQHLLRHGRDGPDRRADQSQFAHRRRGGGPRRDRRALRAAASRRASGRRRAYRQFRRSEECARREGRQGQSSGLSGRCARGRGREYRRRHHHLQL